MFPTKNMKCKLKVQIKVVKCSYSYYIIIVYMYINSRYRLSVCALDSSNTPYTLFLK